MNDDQSKVEKLIGNLQHYSYYTMDEHDRQLEKFSTISAYELSDKGVRSYWFKIYMKTIAKFLKIYFLKLGFLDGYYGWVISVKSSRESFLRYSKLRRLYQSSLPSQ